MFNAFRKNRNKGQRTYDIRVFEGRIVGTWKDIANAEYTTLLALLTRKKVLQELIRQDIAEDVDTTLAIEEAKIAGCEANLVELAEGLEKVRNEGWRSYRGRGLGVR